ncbi:uncharacterized [Tachysurus ichikawai]
MTTSPPSLSHTSGTSVIIILSVLVVLLLFAIVLYLFIKWKRNKHDLSSSSNTDQLNNRQLEHTSEDYEEIGDITCHLDPCSVNIITETPADPSDPPADPSDPPADPSDPAAYPTQSLEYTLISHCSKFETASRSATQETKDTE